MGIERCSVNRVYLVRYSVGAFRGFFFYSFFGVRVRISETGLVGLFFFLGLVYGFLSLIGRERGREIYF